MQWKGTSEKKFASFLLKLKIFDYVAILDI